MERKKRILVVSALVFFIAVIIISIDISQRTTFPGSRPQLKERLEKEYFQQDSTATDSLPI